jgi:hypothetical protein
MGDTATSPALSIVVTSRNDDHGGNMLGRMQIFVTGLLEQCRRHQLDGELILVEWNPPPDRPRLADALSWPKEPGPCRVRIIEVPPETHRRRYKLWQALPLHQMIAKNVGIRRARGRFVLATTVDLLFSDELVSFLASGTLEPGRLYRIDRYDVPADVPVNGPVEKQLEYCRTHVIRVATRDGIYSPSDLPSHRLSLWQTAPPLAMLGKFMSLFLPSWPKGEPLSDVVTISRLREFLADRVRLVDRAIKYGFRLKLPWLHLYAPGDFTLMAREPWFDLHGYPEFEVYPLHVDTLFCYMACIAGISENVLGDPMRIYHIEHGLSWTPETERQGELREWLTSGEIPHLSLDQVEAWAFQMKRKQHPLFFNDQNWGLADEEFKEIEINCANEKQIGL